MAYLQIVAIFVCLLGGCAIPFNPAVESYHDVHYEEISVGEVPESVMQTLREELPKIFLETGVQKDSPIENAMRGHDPKHGVVYRLSLASGSVLYFLEDGSFLSMTI
jgi:hypothetical protein